MAKTKKDFIEGPAGKNDSFVLHLADTHLICDEGVLKPNKKNTKTIILGKESRWVEQAISTELEGVVIKAYDNKSQDIAR